MAVLLVTYDPEKNPGKSNKELKEYLEKFKHVKLSANSYAIKTKEHPKVVSWELQNILEKDTTYYVVALSAPYDGFGLAEVNDWLKKNLKK